MNSMEEFNKIMFARGIFPHTIPWVLNKVKFFKYIADEQKAKLKFNLKNEFTVWGSLPWFRLMLAIVLLKAGLLKNWVIKFFEWLHFLPKKLRPKWYLKMDGLKIFMNDGDSTMMSILQDWLATKRQHGIWEPRTTWAVKKFTKEGDICIDVGASIGWFTMQFARRAGPTGKVFAFEPTPNQIPYITENVRKNGFKDIVKIFNVGAWDKTEDIKLPVNAGVKYESKGVAIDDVLEAEGIQQIDLAKIDVDGPEVKVLKGLERTIKRSSNMKLIIEYYPKYILDAGDKPEEFQKFIKNYFKVSIIPSDYTEDCWNLFCERL